MTMTRAIKGICHLWAQKVHASEIQNNKQLEQIMNNITYDRQKHELPVNNWLQPIVSQRVKLLSKAFSQEEKIKLLRSEA